MESLLQRIEEKLQDFQDNDLKARYGEVINEAQIKIYQEDRQEGVEEFLEEIHAEFMALIDETRNFFKNCNHLDLIGK